MSSSIRTAFCSLVLLVASDARLQGESSSDSAPDISLEDLINIKVTSVSKKATRLENSPAAITVITQEDIRRMGITSIPEALRIVPGMDVARINASDWAISSRGFNSQYANKLLVLVDGRTVYTPSFGGVYWATQDLMMEDLDRIEIIRGPGATLWGANAVNGVINIMTKSAKETQGFLGSVAYGTDLQPLANMRYGGQLGANLYYRVYGQFLNEGAELHSNGTEARDLWNSSRSGLRLDWQPSDQNHFTLQGDYNNQEINQTFNEAQLTPAVNMVTKNAENHNYAGNVLGRWTHNFESGVEGSLQIYYDAFQHVDGQSLERRETLDVSSEHRIPMGSRNEVVWGLGYRLTPDEIDPSASITWEPPRTHQQLFSAFLEDEIKLIQDKLALTLGSKFEHNDFTGFEIEPSARLLWTPTAHQSVWSAISRAVRTPSRLESGARINTAVFQPPFSPPILAAVLPAGDLKSEELIAYEVGYRVQPVEHLAFDLAGFHNTYHDLYTFTPEAGRFEATPPPGHLLLPLQGRYGGSGETYGAELQAQWSVTDQWRLIASYTWLHMRLQPDRATEGESPQQQFNVRSQVDVGKCLEFNATACYVDQTSHALGSVVTLSSYIRLDLGLTWRPSKNLELSVWGQNLLDDRHGEFNNIQTSFVTEISRSFLGKVTWRF